ncbi:ComF family protein [Vreelandella sp. EE22]
MALRHWFEVAQVALKKALPGYCAFCLSPDAHAKGWCDECYALLAHNGVACPQCKEPRAASDAPLSTTLCRHCLSAPPAFSATTAEFLYQGAVKELVRDFKFHASPRAGMLLVELMLEKPPDHMGDALLGVPMHRSKARERGFNQASWLAEQLAKRLGMDVVAGQCIKRVPSQRTLDRKARADNLEGAFRLPEKLPDHVIVVDDVITTGATGHELARMAIAAGARRVELWAPARTPLGTS